MERIQSALEKARAARSGEAPAPQGPGAPPTQRIARSTRPGTQEAWQRIAAFEPDVKLLKKHRILSATGGKDSAAFDVMRTRMLQQMRSNGWTRVAVTSPSAGCGKTTTCLNLAFSLARQPEQRTVVAEIDLRRPGLARLLGMRRPGDFAAALAGREHYAEQMVRVGDNVAFATAAGPARNSAELLQGESARECLDRMSAELDPTVMIFDMPPMLVSDDTMAFLDRVDCVLLVAAAETTSIAEVDLCERDLAAQTNVLGVVLNKCRYMDKSYGYNYYG